MQNISPIELKKFVEENPKLVTRKESKRYPGLFVLKYGREVFYKNLWHVNPLLLECRGLVVDSDYNVIVKPFTKVFNYGENGTTIDRDEECTWARKVNGFLGVVTYDSTVKEDGLIYSTTGSLDSDFVDLIAKHVEPLKDAIMGLTRVGVNKFKTTLMFEICDPSDPHIITEEEGAWLIGCDLHYDSISSGDMAAETTLDYIAKMIGAKRAECGVGRFSDIVKMANECDHEGYMVYGHQSGTALKIKSPYYLVTKFLARAGEKKLLSTILSGDPSARERIDEEYYPLIDHLATIPGQFNEMDEQTRIAYVRKFLENK